MTFLLWPWAVSTTTTSTSASISASTRAKSLHARRRADAQPAAPVFARVRELVQLVDVAHRDQPGQPILPCPTSSSFSTLAL